MKYDLAKKVDSTVPKDRWVASLSNGETIYENDVPGSEPAWTRLARYVEEKGLSITNLRLQLSNTEVKLPPGAQGYIQKKIAWGFSENLNGVSKCIGYVQDGLALIYEIDTRRGSRTVRGVDPGCPQTIYRKDIRDTLKESA